MKKELEQKIRFKINEFHLATLIIVDKFDNRESFEQHQKNIEITVKELIKLLRAKESEYREAT